MRGVAWLEPRPQVRRLPQRLRSQPHFGWKLRAPVEVRADVLGEILPTPRAYIRPATERIGGEFHGSEAEESAVTLMASSALAQSSHRSRRGRPCSSSLQPTGAR